MRSNERQTLNEPKKKKKSNPIIQAVAVLFGGAVLLRCGMVWIDEQSDDRRQALANASAANVHAQNVLTAPAPAPKFSYTDRFIHRMSKSRHDTLTPQDMLAVYADNELAGDAKWKGHEVVVTGMMGEVKKDVLGGVYVTLGSGKRHEMRKVQCFIDKESLPYAMGMKKGEQVVCVGRVSGLMMNVLVKESQVLKQSELGAAIRALPKKEPKEAEPVKLDSL